MLRIVPIVKKNDERKPVKLEERTLPVCPNCSRNEGVWHTVSTCDCGCEEKLLNKEDVVCSDGRHYLKECFERMKKEGYVEEE
jgi:hypothetical protein